MLPQVEEYWPAFASLIDTANFLVWFFVEHTKTIQAVFSFLKV